MGQYFIFINNTTNETGKIPDTFNNGLQWIPKLNYMDKTEIIEIFIIIIAINKWNYFTGDIEAHGDSGDIITAKELQLDTININDMHSHFRSELKQVLNSFDILLYSETITINDLLTT
jgi:hypothetical protein